MKYLLKFIAFTTIVSFTACKPSPQGSANRFENSLITLEKQECYGTCPVYTVTVSGTGKVVYEGKRFVKKEGKFEKQLSTAQTYKLFNAYECANFFDFKTEYNDELISDLPSTYISFEHRGFKRKILDRYNAPEELKDLEKMVEEIVESEEGWIRASDE